MARQVDEATLTRRCAQGLACVRDQYAGKPGSLIGALQLLQDTVGYLPREALGELARIVGVTEAELFGVATFYAQFSLAPRGRHTIRVCRGTACHVRKSDELLAAVEKSLGIKEGQTTPDLAFTLEVVACLGTCFLAPVMMIDSDYYGNVTLDQLPDILAAAPS